MIKSLFMRDLRAWPKKRNCAKGLGASGACGV